MLFPQLRTTVCVDASDQDRLAAWLSHRDRSDREAKGPAICCVVPALGIYWAHEGKNRVQFLRDRGLSYIPANLTAYSYPAPDRIELFEERVFGRDEVWAVLDRRWVRPILIPRIGTPVLREYGVLDASRWPENWPDAKTVAEQMYRDGDPDGARPFRCVDLHPLEASRLETERSYKQLEASIIKLDGIRFKPGPLVAFLGVCVALSVGGAAIGSGCRWYRLRIWSGCTVRSFQPHELSFGKNKPAQSQICAPSPAGSPRAQPGAAWRAVDSPTCSGVWISQQKGGHMTALPR